MRKATWLGVLVGIGVLGTGAWAADVPPDRTPAPPTVPADVQGKDGVKAYLLAVVDSITSATRDFKTAATEYDNHGASFDPSLKNETIASTGGGIRFWFDPNITAGIEAARTLRAVPGSDGGSKTTKVLIDASIRF